MNERVPKQLVHQVDAPESCNQREEIVPCFELKAVLSGARYSVEYICTRSLEEFVYEKRSEQRMQ